MGLVLDTSPHFATTLFTPTSTSSVMHLDVPQTTITPPPSLEGQTSMTLGTLAKKKKLALEPIWQL
jgi:hypothetical protein